MLNAALKPEDAVKINTKGKALEVSFSGCQNGRYATFYINDPEFIGKKYALKTGPESFVLELDDAGIVGHPNGGDRQAKFSFSTRWHNIKKSKLKLAANEKLQGRLLNDGRIVFDAPKMEEKRKARKSHVEEKKTKTTGKVGRKSAAAVLVNQVNALLESGDYHGEMKAGKLVLFRRQLVQV